MPNEQTPTSQPQAPQTAGVVPITQQPTQSTPTLDPVAQILTNAIRMNEGGTDANAKGDNGASWGLYQFSQGTWDTASKAAGVSAPWGQATPDQQNQVAYTQVENWLKQGYNPAQVVSMWNAGQGAPDAYKGTFPDGNPSVGFNPTDNVNYDVPSYVKNVLNTASTLYDKTQGTQNQNTPSTGGGVLSDIATGAGAALGVGKALASKIPGAGLILPIGGTIAGEAVGGPAGAVVGGEIGSEVENAINPQTAPSQAYSSIQDALTQTVGGNAVLQEAKARGVDPIAIMEQSGAIPQPDENGNLNKDQAIQTLSDQIAQDKQFQTSALANMNEETSLAELEQAALNEAKEKMQGSPDLLSTQEKIKKTFASYRAMQPKGKDTYGYPYTKSFKVNSAQLQQMKERVAEGQNWATPAHERSASQHIYSTMRKKLSEIAKKHNVKGWDETNKRMEARILAKKAIKKLPKKAARDKGKEFRKDLMASILGGVTAKAFGQNSLAGGIVGHLIESKLGKREYKKFGSKEDQRKAVERSKTPQKSLIH